MLSLKQQVMMLVSSTEIENSRRGASFMGEDDSFTFGHLELRVPVRHPSKDIKGADTDMKSKGDVRMWASSAQR